MLGWWLSRTSRRGRRLSALGILIMILGMMPFYLAPVHSAVHLYGGYGCYVLGFATIWIGAFVSEHDLRHPPHSC